MQVSTSTPTAAPTPKPATPAPTPAPTTSSTPKPATSLVGVDIGATAIPGKFTFNSGVFSVSGAGNDVWGTADATYFVHTPVAASSDVIITAQVSFKPR